MTRKILGRCLGTVALVAAALLIARLDVHAAPPEDNKEVSQLLEDIKRQAAALQRDSDELESFTRSDRPSLNAGIRPGSFRRWICGIDLSLDNGELHEGRAVWTSTWRTLSSLHCFDL